MVINLKSIDFDGESFRFDHKSEELHGAFQDILGNNPFAVDLHIGIMGNSFQVHGQFESSYQDVCSRCGYDISVPVRNKINEVLVKEKERPRQSKSVHGQNSLDFDVNLPSVTYVHTDEFNLSEFLHEVVAFSMKRYPVCEDTKVCDSRAHKLEPEQDIQSKGHPAFAALKKMKH